MIWNGGLQGNLLATVITVIYCQSVIASCDALHSMKWISSDASRKIVHLAAGSLVVWWDLFDRDDWSWRLNVTVPVVYALQLFVKGAILRDRNDPDVRTMSRSGNPTELLYGPLFFTIVMSICGLWFFQDPMALYMMAGLGYGDGVAPLFGKRVPLYLYRCPGGVKSVGGSLSVFAFSILGFLLFHFVAGYSQGGLDWTKIFVMATTATVSEALSPKEADNLIIPVAIYGALRWMDYSRQ